MQNTSKATANAPVLEDAIAVTRTHFEGLDDSARATLDTILAVEPVEHFTFQNTQAEAFAAGQLALEDAQTIYAALGEGSTSNGGWAKGTDLATKYVVTRVIEALLGAKIARRSMS